MSSFSCMIPPSWTIVYRYDSLHRRPFPAASLFHTSKLVICCASQESWLRLHTNIAVCQDAEYPSFIHLQKRFREVIPQRPYEAVNSRTSTIAATKNCQHRWKMTRHSRKGYRATTTHLNFTHFPLWSREMDSHGRYGMHTYIFMISTLSRISYTKQDLRARTSSSSRARRRGRNTVQTSSNRRPSKEERSGVSRQLSGPGGGHLSRSQMFNTAISSSHSLTPSILARMERRKLSNPKPCRPKECRDPDTNYTTMVRVSYLNLDVATVQFAVIWLAIYSVSWTLYVGDACWWRSLQPPYTALSLDFGSFGSGVELRRYEGV